MCTYLWNIWFTLKIDISIFVKRNIHICNTVFTFIFIYDPDQVYPFSGRLLIKVFLLARFATFCKSATVARSPVHKHPKLQMFQQYLLQFFNHICQKREPSCCLQGNILCWKHHKYSKICVAPRAQGKTQTKAADSK